MAANCKYEAQLREASGLVAERAGIPAWNLVFQSRSGPPQQPWLEPDISDAIRSRLADDPSLKQVVVIPIGFVSDHLEVIYDLDTVAAQLCEELQIGYARVPTVGVHPRFIRGLRELIEERLSGSPERATLGQFSACPDVCPIDCCTYEPRPAGRPRPSTPTT
jgi:ferrochelatase